jgi:hypothetical protein
MSELEAEGHVKRRNSFQSSVHEECPVQRRGAARREVHALLESSGSPPTTAEGKGDPALQLRTCYYIRGRHTDTGDEFRALVNLPMKSMANLPSEARPVGCPKKVIP